MTSSETRASGADAVAGTGSGYAVSVLTANSEPSGVAALVALFERVAREEGWQPGGGGLWAHAGRSVYFALTAGGGAGQDEPTELAGGLQLVLPDRALAGGGLPCLSVWPELPLGDPADRAGGAAHVAVMVIGKEWRGLGDTGGLFWLLGVALWRHCVASGITELWLEATPATLRCYRRIGWPLIIRGELREHWGEPCYPCSMSVREVAGSLAEKATRSPSYRRILADALDIGTGGTAGSVRGLTSG